MAASGAAATCGPGLPALPKLPTLPPAHPASPSPAAAQKPTVRLRRLSTGSFLCGGVLDMAPHGSGLPLPLLFENRGIYPTKLKAMKEKGILSRHDGAAGRV